MTHHRLVRVALAAASLLTLTACGDSILGPSARRQSAAAAVRDPILFVHGWNASAATWTTMVGRFRADGWTSADLATFSYNTAQSNATTSLQIQTKVDSILRVTGATRVDIITHSMGAISARHYIKNRGGAAKVDAFVSLAGTNHGTQTAYACLQTACLQMWPNSSFLSSLNATDETPGTPRYATWWSACDEAIYPQRSALLSGATNTQTACIGHSAMHQDAAVYAQVRNWTHPAAAVVASM